MNDPWHIFLIVALIWFLFPVWLHIVVKTASTAWLLGQNEAYKTITKEIQTNGKTQ